MTCAALPIVAAHVSSPFGMRSRPSGPDLHTGIDLAAPEGTAVFSVLPGMVVVSEPSGRLSGYGNVVVVQHGPALFSLYAHLSRRAVQKGQRLESGALVGEVGRTAGTPADPSKMFASSGAHLHFEALRRWPPAGRDLDRLDPAQAFGPYGLVVPTTRAPLTVLCSGETPSDTVHVQNGSNVPRLRSSSSFGGAVVALAVLLAAHSALRNS